ncbi:MAG: four helix bundle protein [Candidatus Omnitrophica bacterium]|nr:four helix bundle protein [Candidatus Omnitrophota bacterium]
MKNLKLKIDIDKRSYGFALQIVKLVRSFPKETAGFEIGKQLLRSGTSIAANIEEAQGAFSKADFIYKMNTALKEARETNFWLRLVKDSRLMINSKGLGDLIKESVEVKNILASIVKSSKRNK